MARCWEVEEQDGGRWGRPVGLGLIFEQNTICPQLEDHFAYFLYPAVDPLLFYLYNLLFGPLRHLGGFSSGAQLQSAPCSTKPPQPKRGETWLEYKDAGIEAGAGAHVNSARALVIAIRSKSWHICRCQDCFVGIAPSRVLQRRFKARALDPF